MKVICLNFSNNDHVEVRSAYSGEEVKKSFLDMQMRMTGHGCSATYLEVLDELEELGVIHKIETSCDEYIDIDVNELT